jgi:hypothetical protein
MRVRRMASILNCPFHHPISAFLSALLSRREVDKLEMEEKLMEANNDPRVHGLDVFICRCSWMCSFVHAIVHTIVILIHVIIQA